MLCSGVPTFLLKLGETGENVGFGRWALGMRGSIDHPCRVGNATLSLKVSYKGEHQLKVVSIVNSLHLRDLYIKECLLPVSI